MTYTITENRFFLAALMQFIAQWKATKKSRAEEDALIDAKLLQIAQSRASDLANGKSSTTAWNEVKKEYGL